MCITGIKKLQSLKLVKLSKINPLSIFWQFSQLFYYIYSLYFCYQLFYYGRVKLFFLNLLGHNRHYSFLINFVHFILLEKQNRPLIIIFKIWVLNWNNMQSLRYFLVLLLKIFIFCHIFSSNSFPFILNIFLIHIFLS